ncbi:MAG: hypothetical protein ABI855_20150 [Bacteroidota bacterium]
MKRNKILLWLGAVILILVLTNPTPRDLKDHVGTDFKIKREYNFLIFSVYSYTQDSTLHFKGQIIPGYSETIYFGILKNFIVITERNN